MIEGKFIELYNVKFMFNFRSLKTLVKSVSFFLSRMKIVLSLIGHKFHFTTRIFTNMKSTMKAVVKDMPAVM